MEKRVRSPNYPAISLPDAIEKIGLLYKAQHTHGAPREVVAKNIGYNGLNGASATVISALHKYGLLDRNGEELQISDRAMRILHPHGLEEKASAISEAAKEPVLFQELAEKFPGRLPNEEVLRNYLIRNGFAPSAVSGVILSYRDTIDLVQREGGGYDSAKAAVQEGVEIVHQLPAGTAPKGHPLYAAPPIIQQIQTDERLIAQYNFEGGGYVRIVTGGDIETQEALDTAETIIGMKRAEIERSNKRRADIKPLVAKPQPEPEIVIDDDDI